MKIVKTFPRIIVITDEWTELALRIRMNMEVGVLEVLAPNGTVWASAATIEGLQQQLFGMTIEAKDLRDDAPDVFGHVTRPPAKKGTTDGDDSTGS